MAQFLIISTAPLLNLTPFKLFEPTGTINPQSSPNDNVICAGIDNECGLQGVPLIDLSHVPYGLNTEELERYLRQHREEIRNPALRRLLLQAETPTDIEY
jgi:hypothetical protein